MYLAKPRAADFQPEDIARALSYEHRYAGNWGPYSVAQHACIVARIAEKLGGYPPQVLAALHHDDGEAITGDIPGPVKRHLSTTGPGLEELDIALKQAIEERYQIDLDDEIVERADALAFTWEVYRLVPPDSRGQYEPLPVSPPGFRLPYVWFMPWPAERAFAEYMDIHEKCVIAIEAHVPPEEYTRGVS